MIKTATREKIKGFLEGFLEAQLVRHTPSALNRTETERLQENARTGKLKPFHNAILPPEIVSISSFERSFSTALGTSFEECARLIALDNHKESERGKRLSGSVSKKCSAEIQRARAVVDTGGSFDYREMVKRVVAANDREAVEIRTITDLYIKTHRDEEYYFEIKSPMPNKGQGIEVAERLLKTHAIRQSSPPKVNTYFAMAYNPYGNRANYRHSFALRHLDMEHEVVIQEEFWNIVGGKGTFSALLEIYAEVGKERGPQIIKRLGYNF